jgi:hypothetical protein
MEDKMSKETVSLNFYGLPLIVTGDYYKGCAERGEWNYSLGTPAENPEFIIEDIKVEGLPDADPESIITQGKLWQVLEQDCLDKIERNM